MGKQVKIIEKGKLSRETVPEMCIQGFLNLHKNIVMKTYGETQRGQAKNNQKACKLNQFSEFTVRAVQDVPA